LRRAASLPSTNEEVGRMRFPIRPAAGWPTTVGGRLSVAFAAAFVVMFAW
jgi:hypothetical protein